MRIGALHPESRSRGVLTRAVVLTAASLAAASCLHTRGSTSLPRLSERERVIHLLSRTTYGVRPQDVENALELGRERWLERQLQPDAIADQVLETRIAASSAQTPTRSAVIARPAPPAPAATPSGAPLRAAMDSLERQMVRASQTARIRVLASATPNAIVGAKLERAVYSERQLEEVMTDFWFNHFNVFFNKGQIRTVIADYESSAIRPHVFGRFEDMLVATARHPAMLWYLDNFMSTAPSAPAATPARGRARPRGLNENYARELLELHTLGVDGGYTQQDVIEVARAFTGWGVSNRPVQASGAPLGAASPTVRFEFSEINHDGGVKTVLGQPVTANRGIDEGMQILGMLARHPSTARHLATKLVRHFVADDPPPALVDKVARVFLETDGDLRAVTRTLFTAEEFYRPEHYRAKVKRPFEFIASAIRATQAELAPAAPAMVTQLRQFRHLPYSEAAPTGYGSTADEWVSAGAMLARMNFGLDMVAGRVGGVSVDTEAAAGDAIESSILLNTTLPAGEARSAGTDAELYGSIASLLEKLQAGIPSDRLTPVIVEDLLQPRTSPQPGAGRGNAGRSASANAPGGRSSNLNLSRIARVIGLALGSPEFQRY